MLFNEIRQPCLVGVGLVGEGLVFLQISMIFRVESWLTKVHTIHGLIQIYISLIHINTVSQLTLVNRTHSDRNHSLMITLVSRNRMHPRTLTYIFALTLINQKFIFLQLLWYFTIVTLEQSYMRRVKLPLIAYFLQVW